ncbi:MAG: hypothetical protein P8N76_27825 [Pirellulaceae bacterium]|nr:hypothetical protein [Pirellulaceae bacterium]
MKIAKLKHSSTGEHLEGVVIANVSDQCKAGVPVQLIQEADGSFSLEVAFPPERNQSVQDNNVSLASFLDPPRQCDS